jgi:peptide/nickel transport system substrate-binding protein
MPSLRVTLWYAEAFWHKYKRVIIASILFGAVLVWLFPTLIRLVPQQQKTRFIGRVGLYTWLEIPHDIQGKVSAGLTELDATGQPVPVLAERWTVEEDGRAFRFLLKEDLKWQDGKPFLPEDVNYNFTDVQTVATENTILFRLKDAYAPFPVVVSQPLFRTVRKTRLGFLHENQIIGLGEYRVTSLKYQGVYISQLVLENSRERLVYRFYPSEEEALIAFRLGKVDTLEEFTSVSDLAPDEFSLYKVQDGVNLRQYVALFFNTADPSLSKEMRQALHYATHKPGPDDPKLRALSPIPATSWAYNSTEEIDPFTYDLDKAVEVYKTVNPPQPLKITIDASVSLLDEAQGVAEDWRQLGLAAKASCEVNPSDDEAGCDRYLIEPQIRALRDLQDFQAALVAREAPADPDQYSWWHSTQTSNISRYQNPRVDKFLEDGRKETNQQKRKLVYFEFQRYLVEDVPAMFMYYLPEYTISRDEIL